MQTETLPNELTEVLARAWIACDPNRAGGEPGSGYHPDDIMGQGCEASAGSSPRYFDTPLTGKPRWHWFIPRAEALAQYLEERGYSVVKKAGHEVSGN